MKMLTQRTKERLMDKQAGFYHLAVETIEGPIVQAESTSFRAIVRAYDKTRKHFGNAFIAWIDYADPFKSRVISDSEMRWGRI